MIRERRRLQTSSDIQWGPGLALAASETDPALHHSVQFYESADFLVETIADFVTGGLSAGEPVVAILRADRRDALSDRLRSKGVNVEHAVKTGQMTLLDSGATLAEIMVGDMPDWDAFDAVVGGTLKKCAARSLSGRVRAYGEMVDVLWTGGNAKAAIRLEELWSDIQKVHSFSLLCAYVMGNSTRRTMSGGSAPHTVMFFP